MSYLPLVRTDDRECGCKIHWYVGEVEPGRYTKIDRVEMCSKHETEYNIERFSQTTRF